MPGRKKAAPLLRRSSKVPSARPSRSHSSNWTFLARKLPLLFLTMLTGGTYRAMLWLSGSAFFLVQSVRARWAQRTVQHDDVPEEGELGTGGNLSMEEFKEKDKSRSLIIGLFALVLYLFGGFWYGKSKGWTYTDAVYFVVVTLTTVGYGDQTFGGSHLDLIFGGLYVFVGVAFIGVVVGEALAELQSRAEKAAISMRSERRKLSEDEDLSLQGALQGGVEATRAQLRGEMNSLMRKLKWSLLQITLTVLLGSFIMSVIEGWSFSYAFLWACVTATTVGYGDIVPDMPQAKWFSMVYILLSFGLVASAIGFIASIPGEARRLRNREKVLMQFGDSLEAEELSALLQSEEIAMMRVPGASREGAEAASVSRAEFILWLLLKQQKLDLKGDVVPCGNIFDTLDPDASGYLDEADIELFAKMNSGTTDNESKSDSPQGEGASFAPA